jgi:hypothetical protein
MIRPIPYRMPTTASAPFANDSNADDPIGAERVAVRRIVTFGTMPAFRRCCSSLIAIGKCEIPP